MNDTIAEKSIHSVWKLFKI